MKRLNLLKNRYTYTKSISLIFKLIIGYSLIHLSIILNKPKLRKIGESIICKNPYILRTPFGNYLATSLQHYSCIYKDYEPEIMDVIKKLKKKDGDYFINIGSNVGRYAIGLCAEYGYNTIAFEPDPSTFHNLQINTLLSNLENKIELFNCGLGNQDGELSFLTGSNCDGMAHIVDDNNTDEYGKLMRNEGSIIKIPVRKFDDLGIDKEKLEKTRLIIMDVEGFEYQVLKGMKKSLEGFHNISIIIEIRENHKDKGKTIDYMKSLGYEVEPIDKENYLFKK